MQLNNIQNLTCSLNEYDLKCRKQQPAGDQRLKSQALEIGNEAKILYDLSKLADGGDANAQFELARRLYYVAPRLIDRPFKNAYSNMAVDKIHAGATVTYNSIGLTDNGGGIAKSASDSEFTYKAEAGKYFKLAADQGHAIAQYSYAHMRYFGEGVEVDKTEALRYFKLAADQGLIIAQYRYGQMRYVGEGAEIDKAEVLRYAKLATEQRLASEQFHYSYEQGTEEWTIYAIMIPASLAAILSAVCFAYQLINAVHAANAAHEASLPLEG